MRHGDEILERAEISTGRNLHLPNSIIGERIEDDFFTLQEDGTLIVNKGFAWDGASGPTFDSRSSMRPSLVHDVFCVKPYETGDCPTNNGKTK